MEFIIEHIDEEFLEWSILEYLSLAKYVFPHRVLFTRCSELPPEMQNVENIEHRGCLVQELDINTERVCLLDSEAPLTLQPSDKTNFDFYLFGGILGNTDEFDKDKTSILRKLGYPVRNLGSVQMSTDTAVKVCYEIVHRGKPFENLIFVDRPIIKESVHEQLILNFRFLADNEKKPIIASGIVELMLKEDGFDEGDLE